MGVSNLRECALGQQTVYITPVNASARLMGVSECEFDLVHNTVLTPHQGLMAPAQIATLASVGASGRIKYDASYEDICFALDGIFGPATITGAGPYTWTYKAPTTVPSKPRVYTIEYGDSTDDYEVDGAIFNRVTISGGIDGDEIWQVTADVMGRRLRADNLTGQSDRTVYRIRMADTALKVDTFAGTMGSTAIASTLIGFELMIDAKHHLKRFAGDLYPSNYGQDRWEATLTTALEYTSTVKAWVDTLAAATPAIVQKNIEISAVDSTRSFKIQFAGTLSDNITFWGDKDGNRIVELTWSGTYNSAWDSGQWLECIAVNAVATLP